MEQVPRFFSEPQHSLQIGVLQPEHRKKAEPKEFWQQSGNEGTNKKACYQFDSRLFSAYEAYMVGRTRFELVTNGLKVRCSTS